MKNNRLTNMELYTIREAITEIKKLSSMENCAYKNDKTIDVEKLKMWLTWFDVYADKIDKIVNNNQ